jgi:hypothetical protein
MFGARMIHEPFPHAAQPTRIADELARARRISLALSGTADSAIVLDYIAELEAKLRSDDNPSLAAI